MTESAESVAVSWIEERRGMFLAIAEEEGVQEAFDWLVRSWRAEHDDGEEHDS